MMVSFPRFEACKNLLSHAILKKNEASCESDYKIVFALFSSFWKIRKMPGVIFMDFFHKFMECARRFNYLCTWLSQATRLQESHLYAFMDFEEFLMTNYISISVRIFNIIHVKNFQFNQSHNQIQYLCQHYVSNLVSDSHSTWPNARGNYNMWQIVSKIHFEKCLMIGIKIARHICTIIPSLTS